jgi:hypothetical protein
VLSQAAYKNTLHTLHSTCYTGVSLGTRYDAGNTGSIWQGKFQSPQFYVSETTHYSIRQEGAGTDLCQPAWVSVQGADYCSSSAHRHTAEEVSSWLTFNGQKERHCPFKCTSFSHEGEKCTPMGHKDFKTFCMCKDRPLIQYITLKCSYGLKKCCEIYIYRVFLFPD